MVRRHPGWSGVGQYDAALRRLEQAAASLPPPGQPTRKSRLCPHCRSVAGAAPGRRRQMLSRISRRLDAVQQSLLDGLQRPAGDGAGGCSCGSSRMSGGARRVPLCPSRPEASSVAPDLELQLLQANVATLTQTVQLETVPRRPRPSWRQLKAKVAAEQARLDALLAERETAAGGGADAAFGSACSMSREARAAYVQAQADALAGRLRADDDAGLIAAQSAALDAAASGPAGGLARPPVGGPVPTAGFAGAETLPHGPGVAQAACRRPV